jgi:EAL domain-containing protein (putative c-di-GMP-specific phosphodiesterase class I)
MEKAIEQAFDIEGKLRHSVIHKDFFLHYQPKVSLEDECICGVEALLRWSPNGESITPTEFIPIAEEIGLIESIGEWVIEQACALLEHWEKNLQLPMNFTLSVNLSVKQIENDRIYDHLVSQLKLRAIKPQRLELEITESILMDQTEEQLTRLCKIHDLGVRISLDDFGTGYSSMSYLTRLPITVLKIDRSFIAEIDTFQGLAIVKAIIALAKALNLDVIAEGVENEEQLALLKTLSCEQVQGFYFSKPIPQQAFEKILNNNNAPSKDKD